MSDAPIADPILSAARAVSTDDVRIRRVGASDEAVEDLIAVLGDVLIDCVEGGASVGFMSPLDRVRAQTFFRGALESADRGERVVLVADVVAEDGSMSVVGTVQVVFASAENQPHRGDISKMLVHRNGRRRGVGERLMIAAEAAAREAGRTLLVLDTATDAAERLYERLGWQRVGAIPDFALGPEGDLVATSFYFKRTSA